MKRNIKKNLQKNKLKIDRILRIKKSERSRKKNQKLNVLLRKDKKLGVLVFS